MNHVIRAAKPGDLQSIYEMAKLTGGGFTNLPPDKKALRAKLERAEAGFASEKEYPADELYLMVLEDLDSGEVRGTCQIFGQGFPVLHDYLGVIKIVSGCKIAHQPAHGLQAAAMRLRLAAVAPTLQRAYFDRARAWCGPPPAPPTC